MCRDDMTPPHLPICSDRVSATAALIKHLCSSFHKNATVRPVLFPGNMILCKGSKSLPRKVPRHTICTLGMRLLYNTLACYCAVPGIPSFASLSFVSLPHLHAARALLSSY